VSKTKKKPADALLDKTVALVAAGGALLALRKAADSVCAQEHSTAFLAAIKRERARALKLVADIHGDPRISYPDLELRMLTMDWMRIHERRNAGEAAPPLAH
jgi:hypothetical protein